MNSRERADVLVGDVLAELAIYGHTRHPIELFRLGRFAAPV